MSALKTRLAPVAARLERVIEPLFTSKRTDAPLIEPYIGYSTADTIVARGRVLGSIRRKSPRADQSWFTNLRQMISLFLTDEVADVTVRSGEHSAVSDEEGYFTLILPRADVSPGWADVKVEEPVEVHLPVLVSHPKAEYGVISDIDDTMMETGAYSLWRNLWTSMTGNALTRHVFPDAVKLMQVLHRDLNPIFYVSSSPWNLHQFLEDIFERNGLVRGPKFLRDLGISETKLITGTHGDHKGSAVDRILAANPDLGFVLIGDTGQHDAEVYLHAVERHPGRIVRVILRALGPGADAKDMDFARKIERMGIPVHVGADYSRVIAALEEGSVLP
ncbi:App1 family protein [Aestuariibius insulae]|uniref:App1 family protein n=1 Tax=Aestuariibius insulae TaxID=2058287 RepID=UPI00345EF326